MRFTRRFLLTVAPALAVVPAWADDNPTRAERFIGSPDAKTTVNE